MKRATIKDIAKALDVNPSTVSRALSDHPDISAAVKRAVKEMAAQLHYHPNHLAINLRKRRSRLIGLIIPEISMFFFPSVIKGIEDIAHQHGYNLMVLQSNELMQREIDNVHICFENGVDGLLLSVSHQTHNLNHLADLQALGVPIVLFDKVVPNAPFHQVIIDDRQAAASAAQHLIATDCERIVGLFGNPNLSITQMRVEGFRQTLLQHGLPVPPEAVQFSANTAEAYRITTALMQQPKPLAPDGFFCMSDEILAGVLPALRDLHIAMPADCAVIAVSDGFLPHYLSPTVTHLHHSGYEVGKQAAALLCRLFDTSVEYAPTAHILPIELVELGSTGAIG